MFCNGQTVKPVTLLLEEGHINPWCERRWNMAPGRDRRASGHDQCFARWHQLDGLGAIANLVIEQTSRVLPGSRGLCPTLVPKGWGAGRA